MPADIEWRVSDAPVPYEEALALHGGSAPPRSATGRRANASGCSSIRPCSPPAPAPTRPSSSIRSDFPVYEAGRGGRYTYHGPGQRVGYVMLDLEKRGKDIRCFVHALEGWMIDTLAELGVAAHRADGRIGIWVGEGADEAKIGALGVRVKRWVTLHGFALNVAPDLSHFGGIVPCGIAEFGVTSLAELGKQIPLTRC